MRSKTASTPARRTLRLTARRTRRRPAILAAGLAFGIIATAGFTVTTPVTLAEASGSTPAFALASFTTPASPAEAPVIEREDARTVAAHAALAAAETTLSAAETLTDDIASAGLDLGVDTAIDTPALEEAVARLSGAETGSPLLVPGFTDDLTALVATLDERVAGLRGSLDAAKAAEAKRIAEEKARRAAAAAAAAAEKAAAATSAPSPVFASGGSGGDNSPAGAQASARAMLGNYGWGDDQFGCLVSLWNKESGWNYRAYNAGSGAYGIPQALPGSKMGSAGADWQTNAATQVAWGLGYISGRYGSPCGAWSHSESVGWY
ncbi:lytic transglycosylase domain-containing protein [Microbacterium sulfonylureivorans]|uniref:aggregation-promoting factor C-terminal-like domain-containing protein n=1 Tax=Microbacterium sulfonylureivorans TaxID=2486854 RepID=UPI00197C1D79|nr:lytic transglycosylase domain-containing protein [Microbacterium sulfonylureivorans]